MVYRAAALWGSEEVASKEIAAAVYWAGPWALAWVDLLERKEGHEMVVHSVEKKGSAQVDERVVATAASSAGNSVSPWVSPSAARLVGWMGARKAASWDRVSAAHWVEWMVVQWALAVAVDWAGY
jgi:hypothetical protein